MVNKWWEESSQWEEQVERGVTSNFQKEGRVDKACHHF